MVAIVTQTVPEPAVRSRQGNRTFTLGTRSAATETRTITYDATQGVRISRDPIGNDSFRKHLESGRSMSERMQIYAASFLPAYVFVHNSPIIHIDVYGLNTKVYVESILVPNWDVGPIFGATHTSIVAICDKTKKAMRFEIGGAPEGKTPPVKTQQLTYPYNTPDQGKVRYQTDCKDTCCEVLDCLEKITKNYQPPPYHALGPNSNTYAHYILSHCGCQVETYTPKEGPYIPDPSGLGLPMPNIPPEPTNIPAGAVGW